jgi:uncharacterized protein (DUF342 family)
MGEGLMAGYNADGYVDIRISQDRTQALADIHPPQGAGRCVTDADVIAVLEKRGVSYGILLEAVEEAVARVAAGELVMRNVLVAQGVLPQNGTDGHVVWRIDTKQASKPIPTRPDGNVDYFALDSLLFVRAGQVLATVVRPTPGTPGKTLTAPFEFSRQAPGREPDVFAGNGVKLTHDKLRFVAEVDGYVELRGNRLTVHAMARIDGNLVGDDHFFNGGLVVFGDVNGATVTAHGPIAVRGSVTWATLRSHSSVRLINGDRSQITADEDVFVHGTLKVCRAVTPKRIVGEQGSVLLGGEYFAAGGIDAWEVGGPDWPETELRLGGEVYTAFRIREIEAEIKLSETNILRIGAALKPLTSITAESISEAKRTMIQTLLDQKRELEQRVRDLLAGRRTQQMMHYPRDKEIRANKVYPGVKLYLHEASLLI